MPPPTLISDQSTAAIFCTKRRCSGPDENGNLPQLFICEQSTPINDTGLCTRRLRKIKAFSGANLAFIIRDTYSHDLIYRHNTHTHTSHCFTSSSSHLPFAISSEPQEYRHKLAAEHVGLASRVVRHLSVERRCTLHPSTPSPVGLVQHCKNARHVSQPFAVHVLRGGRGWVGHRDRIIVLLYRYLLQGLLYVTLLVSWPLSSFKYHPDLLSK